MSLSAFAVLCAAFLLGQAVAYSACLDFHAALALTAYALINLVIAFVFRERPRGA